MNAKQRIEGLLRVYSLTNRELTIRTGYHPGTVRKATAALEREGRIVRGGLQGRSVVWTIQPTTEEREAEKAAFDFHEHHDVEARIVEAIQNDRTTGTTVRSAQTAIREEPATYLDRWFSDSWGGLW